MYTSSRIKLLIAVALLSFTVSTVKAQELQLSGEYRPRAEIRSGYSRPLLDNEEAAFHIMQRTRLGAKFISEKFDLKLVIQDSRVWGETGTNSDAKNSEDALTMYEANLTFKFSDKLQTTLGRQVLQYDDGRILTGGNWSNTATAHDVALVKYQDGGLKLHGALAYNNNSLSNTDNGYNTVTKYRYMGFLWSSQQLTESLLLSEIFIDEGLPYKKATDDGDEQHMWHRYTLGANLKMSAESTPLDFLLSGYYQFGRIANGTELSAYLLAAKAGFKLSDNTKIYAGIDAYSGGKLGDKTCKKFQWLYGGAHPFNGNLDYWSASLPTFGLLDFFMGVTHTFNPKWNAEASIRSLNTMTNIEEINDYGDTDNRHKSLGGEIDFKAQLKPTKGVVAEAGYAFYLINDNTKYLKLGDRNADTKFPQYFYVMLTVKPQDFGIKF